MARNNARYAIALLIIIVVVICSVIMGFHDTIFEQRWTTPYYVGSDLLDPCIARCNRNFPYDAVH
ncbi:hypothetical protein HN873_027026, partial [Arachis hypogaea]